MVTLQQIRDAIARANKADLPRAWEYWDASAGDQGDLPAINDGPLVLTDYTGRSMYGRVCPALSGPSEVAVYAALAIGCETGAEAADMIEGMVSDRLGYSVICYWPGVEWADEDEAAEAA